MQSCLCKEVAGRAGVGERRRLAEIQASSEKKINAAVVAAANAACTPTEQQAQHCWPDGVGGKRSWRVAYSLGGRSFSCLSHALICFSFIDSCLPSLRLVLIYIRFIVFPSFPYSALLHSFAPDLLVS